MNYTTSDVSGIFISYVKIFGEDYALTALKVWDAWVASQAKHYINGWPNGTEDNYEDSANSAGLNGTVTFEISKVDGVLISKIMYGGAAIERLTQVWASFGGANASAVAFYHRSGTYGADTHATFYDLYANFTTTEYTPTSVFVFPTFTFGIYSELIATSAVCIIGMIVYLKKRKS